MAKTHTLVKILYHSLDLVYFSIFGIEKLVCIVQKTIFWIEQRLETELSKAEQIQVKPKYIQNRDSKLPNSKNRMSRGDVVMSRAEYMNGEETYMQSKQFYAVQGQNYKRHWREDLGWRISSLRQCRLQSRCTRIKNKRSVDLSR